jgi:Cu-Zn family superoxide dismutase
MDRTLVRNPFTAFLAAGLLCGGLAVCGVSGQEHAGEHDHDHAAASSVTEAVAVLVSTAGNKVSGTVTFTQEEAGIRVHAEVSGLTPGLHGFHVHEFGNVTKDDGTACGGHFNPHGVEHGKSEARTRHAGDLGNLEADENGKAVYDRLDAQISFADAENIIGRGLIVHEKADDFGQPTGNAGGRVAMGVIGVAAVGHGH